MQYASILGLQFACVRHSYMQLMPFTANVFSWSIFLKILICIHTFLFSRGANLLLLLFLRFRFWFAKSFHTDNNLCIILVRRTSLELSKIQRQHRRNSKITVKIHNILRGEQCIQITVASKYKSRQKRKAVPIRRFNVQLFQNHPQTYES